MQLWVTVKQNLIEIFHPLWSAISVFQHKPTDHYFSDADIAQFFQLQSRNDRVPLDDQTWRDLLIDDYFRVLSKDCSIFAQQQYFLLQCANQAGYTGSAAALAFAASYAGGAGTYGQFSLARF